MRTFVRMVLVVALTAAGIPSGLVTAQPRVSTLKGIAYTADLKPLPSTKVQIRNLQTATVVDSTVTGPAGEYTFENLPPANYVIELVSEDGRIIGMSSPFQLDPGMMVTVSVVSVGQGAMATSGNGAGLSLFGMGPTTTLVVLAAAGAAGVTAVVSTKQDASPSR